MMMASIVALTGCGHPAPPRPGAVPPAPKSAPPAKSGSRYNQDQDSTPGGPPPDVSKIPEPVPKVEPRSQYGNKSPYTVLGETYSVLPEANGYVERGIASWYGNKFHGFTTSTFEKYDMYAYSAASKTLPLPSYARVTNLENGRSVIVRVNDRGPFVQNRVVDLSYVAAVKIGVWPKAAMSRCAHRPGIPKRNRLCRARSQRASAARRKTHKPALYHGWARTATAHAERAAATLKQRTSARCAWSWPRSTARMCSAATGPAERCR
jgi:rare lipoprotein A